MVAKNLTRFSVNKNKTHKGVSEEIKNNLTRILKFNKIEYQQIESQCKKNNHFLCNLFVRCFNYSFFLVSFANKLIVSENFIKRICWSPRTKLKFVVSKTFTMNFDRF